MKKFLKFLVFLFLMAETFVSVNAQLSITARMDSVNLLMGNTTDVYLQVTQPGNALGRLPLFNEIGYGREYVGVCGDSVEFSTSYSVDTVALGSGKIQLDYTLKMQAFDSGTYRLPPFIFVAGADTAYSNNLTFNVIPVAATADDPIVGFANVVAPEGSKFYDFIPDWILDFWWIFIIIALAVILFLYAMKMYGKKTPVIFRERELTPYEQAMRSLQDLKERKLWEQGMEKEYFTRLTDILRTYLMTRFGINALEMTTRQIIERINESEFRDKKDYVKQILNIADFVKFAKVRPLPADNVTAFDNAVKFVEETKPVEMPQEKGDAEK